MPALILIPARLAASRLPGKPLADILGEPMIVHVWRRAVEAEIGPVVVACDDVRIRDAITRAGGEAVMTRADHANGSDRIFEALQLYDAAGHYDVVVNVQGDLPTVEPHVVRAAFTPLETPEVDVATVATEIVNDEDKTASSVVKVIGTPIAPDRLRALYFTRATAPTGPGPLYHHIGLYAYRRAALERYVTLPQTPLEKRERLEQLRLLENGMRIDVGLVETVPLGVDTPADLEQARLLLALKAGA
jgi:3-deoxy-manno-octulosonate cytidylyltransferase (CMP-KDO synthetase)